jgi:phosphohistidine phosphatase
MRRLLILRHAKAAPLTKGEADIDRPLAPRGRRAAPRMGVYLAAERLIPDLALVSSAQRTRETWDGVSPALGEIAMRFEPQIYEASADRLLALLRGVEDGVGTLLIIGHNPGLEDLAGLLAGQSDRAAASRMARKFPTASLAVIELDVATWGEAAARSGRLDRFVTPKSLGVDGDD